MSNVGLNPGSDYSSYKESVPKSAAQCGACGAVIGGVSYLWKTKKSLKNMEDTFASADFQKIIKKRPKRLLTPFKTPKPLGDLKDVKFSPSKKINVGRYLEAKKLKSIYNNIKEGMLKNTFKEAGKYALIGIGAGILSALLANSLFSKKSNPEASSKMEVKA